MSDRMRNPELDDLERSLRALADEDCQLQAPPHVHAAVMHKWDTVRPLAQRRRQRRRSAALFGLGSMAAAVVGVVIYRTPSTPSGAQPVVAHVAETAHVVTSPRRLDNVPAAAHRPRPRRSTTRDRRAEPRERGIVLLADPILDRGATSIVRVRMSRQALIALGIPLVEPNDTRSMDLEMLVGEDGVAHTIRRAVPVGVRQE
jgi:hypothetical protein